MYYQTFPVNKLHAKPVLPEFAQLLQQLYQLPHPEAHTPGDQTFTQTLTRERPNLPAVPYSWFTRIHECLSAWAAQPCPMDYIHFQIPKKSGGIRELQAPNPQLKERQKILLKHLMYDGRPWPYVYMHNAAFAYIPGRSAKHAMQVHQANNSRWFLKLDIKDFFPSCSAEFLRQQMECVMPLAGLTAVHKEFIVDLCTYQGALPQGSPMSPFLSNLVMIPFDKALTDVCYKLIKHKLVYTRYADDILISCTEHFNWEVVVNEVDRILQSLTPFHLNREKTRYGSSAGRNWNLGIMLNKDNELTIGHARKETLRVSLYKFFQDYQQGKPWSIPEAQSLQGELAYFQYIEPHRCGQMIRKMELRFNLRWSVIIKAVLNP